MAWLKRHLGTVGFLFLFAGYILYSVTRVFDWKPQVLLVAGSALLAGTLLLKRERIWRVMSSRQGRAGGLAGGAAILVIGIVVLLNFLNFKNNWRFDLTEEKLHALASQSVKVVENLGCDVRVTGFFSDPSHAQRFRDLLRQYSDLSDRVQAEVVDPEASPLAAERHRIDSQGQTVIECGPKSEIVELLDSGPGGRWNNDNEARITNALIKVTREGDKRVYFLQGHGERDIEDTREEGFSTVVQELRRQNYGVETWNLAQQNRLPEDADVVISAGPQVDLLAPEVALLKDYLARGGNFLLLADPQTDFHMNEGFLADYGLSLRGDIVLDISGVGQLLQLGPAAPVVASYADHPITREISQIMTFYPRAQSLRIGESPLGFVPQGLLSTSPRSWGEMRPEDDDVQFDEGTDEPGPLYLAAVSTKTLEAAPSQAQDDFGAEETESGGGREGEKTAPDEARLVAFGDSDFATNLYFSIGRNGDLLLMTIHWLAEDQDLLAIRPRSQTDRRLDLSLAASQILKWTMTILLPLAALAAGLMVWSSRR